MSGAARGAARRERRAEERSTRYEIATATGWCEREVDLPVLRLQVDATLARRVRARRRSASLLRTYTGDEAIKHVDALIASVDDETLLASYRKVLDNLRDRGGFVVTAAADAAR